MASGDTKTQQYLDVAANGTRADLPSDTCCETRTQTLIRGVAERIMDVEDEVERLENNPDVVDIVGTYADLQAYDTSTLTNKDIIRVLSDETHSDNSTYYRWNDPNSGWNFIGEISGGVNVVQTTGTSTTDVMSQKAVTDTIFKNNDTTKVQIGSSADASGNTYYPAIAIGRGSRAAGGNSISLFGTASGDNSVTIGGGSAQRQGSISIGLGTSGGRGSVAIGGYSGTSNAASATHDGGIAIGAGAITSAVGEMNIGDRTSTYGYNSSAYRLLTGLYDGQSAHDAVTVEQVNATIDAINTALSTNIPHIGA